MAQAKMTRAHFVMIAETIVHCELDWETTLKVAACFAVQLRYTNNEFKPDRFLTFVEKVYRDKGAAKKQA